MSPIYVPGKVVLRNNMTSAWAEGGDLVYTIVVGGTTYRVHEFKTVGTSSLTVMKGGSVEYLVVAGGGAGRGNGAAGNSGDGGNAGQLLAGSVSLAVGSQTVTVGQGGIGVVNANGGNGGNSVLAAVTATGGVGGSGVSAVAARNGGAGGTGTREDLAAALKLALVVPGAHLPLLVLQLFTQVAVVAVLPWVDLAAAAVAVAVKITPQPVMALRPLQAKPIRVAVVVAFQMESELELQVKTAAPASSS